MTKEQLDAIRERRIKATGIAIRETKGEAFRAIQLSLLDIPALLDEVERLRKRCEAAVGDLKSTNYDYMNHEDCPCRYCKHGHNSKCSLCDWDKNINAFEWRGPEGESDASDS